MELPRTAAARASASSWARCAAASRGSVPRARNIARGPLLRSVAAMARLAAAAASRSRAFTVALCGARGGRARGLAMGRAGEGAAHSDEEDDSEELELAITSTPLRRPLPCSDAPVAGADTAPLIAAAASARASRRATRSLARTGKGGNRGRPRWGALPRRDQPLQQFNGRAVRILHAVTGCRRTSAAPALRR